MSDPAAPDLDEVLTRVAAGELTPDEALALLGPGTAGGAGASPPPPPPPGPRSPATPTALRRILLRTPSRPVQVVGDPSVREVAVNGGHLLHRDGDALVIESPSVDLPAPGRFTIAALARALPGSHEQLVVRMNPDLLLDVDVAATALKAADLRGGVRLHLLASSAKLDNVAGSLEIEAISSSVKGSVRVTEASRIDCESSSVKLMLIPGSDLSIRARNRLGKVMLPEVAAKGGIGEPGLLESRIGTGTHSLTIDAVMSSVFLGALDRAARR